MKVLVFTIVILVAATGAAKNKSKSTKAAKGKSTASMQRSSKQGIQAAVPQVSLQRAPVKTIVKIKQSRKSRADLSGAITDSFQGRSEIQKEVQSAAGIEKTKFEPMREEYKVEIPSSVVSTVSEGAAEPQFVAPRRGPASSDVKGLMSEIDESEKED